MEFNYNDGGRAAAGFKRTTRCGDCVCRAIAIATQRPYIEIYSLILHFAKQERTGKRKRRISDPEKGVFRSTERKVMAFLGWEWVPTMGIGTGCKVHLRADELPAGRIVANVSHHFTAVIDGVINDIFDPSRGETRCVYGYYRPTEKALEPTDPLPIVLNPVSHPKSELSSIDYSYKPKDARKIQNERKAQKRERNCYTEDGWKIFSKAEMRRTVESLIPEDMRPYYTGVEICTEYEGTLTADNSDIYVYFRKPVCGPISDTRYVHCSLYDLTQELDSCYISGGEDDEYYAEYDDEYGNRPVVPIKVAPVGCLIRDREAVRATWKRKSKSETAA